MSREPAEQRGLRFWEAGVVAILGTVLAVLAHFGYVAFAFVMSIASIPAGCGFDSSDNCTNPDANQGGLIVVLVIGYLVLLTGLAWAIRRLIRTSLGVLATGIPAHWLFALGAALGIVPGLALLALWSASDGTTASPSQAAIATVVLAAIGAIGVWARLLQVAVKESGAAGE